jgi:hypothetical protein
MKFNFTDPRKGFANKSLSRKEIEKISRWEKERADGKWFWIFKRASAWLVSLILMFGAANFFAAEMVSFDGTQIFVALFMFGGFFAGSIMEWTKMEELYQANSLTTD